MKDIKDTDSFNKGINAALQVLRQQFFAGNLNGDNPAITQIEKLLIPVADNGVEQDIPESVKEIYVEPKDILALVS